MSDYPSLPEQGKKLVQTVFDVFNYIVQNGPENVLTSEEVATERIKICHLCEEFDAIQNRCRNCGCFLPPKVKLVIEKCPLNKWPDRNEKAVAVIETMIQSMQNEKNDETNETTENS